MLTKRQFMSIAEILREEKAPALAIDKFARWLATENPKFDWEKFRRACTEGTSTPSTLTVEELDKFIERMEAYKLFTTSDGYSGRVFKSRSLILWIPFALGCDDIFSSIMRKMNIREEHSV